LILDRIKDYLKKPTKNPHKSIQINNHIIILDWLSYRALKAIKKMRFQLIMVLFVLQSITIGTASSSESGLTIDKMQKANIGLFKVDLKKIDNVLFTFISLSKKINEMKLEQEFNLTKFLEIHDQLLNNFNGSSIIEMKMFNILMKLLKDYLEQSSLNISLNKLKSRAFRWG